MQDYLLLVTTVHDTLTVTLLVYFVAVDSGPSRTSIWHDAVRCAPARDIMRRVRYDIILTFRRDSKIFVEVLHGTVEQSKWKTLWTNWKGQYLEILRQSGATHRRVKGQIDTSPVVGTVVIIKDDKKHRCDWKFGRIMEVSESTEDGRIRSAIILTTA